MDKQRKPAERQPSADEVLRRMLTTPPTPHNPKVRRKAKKRPK